MLQKCDDPDIKLNLFIPGMVARSVPQDHGQCNMRPLTPVSPSLIRLYKYKYQLDRHSCQLPASGLLNFFI